MKIKDLESAGLGHIDYASGHLATDEHFAVAPWTTKKALARAQTPPVKRISAVNNGGDVVCVICRYIKRRCRHLLQHLSAHLFFRPRYHQYRRRRPLFRQPLACLYASARNSDDDEPAVSFALLLRMMPQLPDWPPKQSAQQRKRV